MREVPAENAVWFWTVSLTWKATPGTAVAGLPTADIVRSGLPTSTVLAEARQFPASSVSATS